MVKLTAISPSSGAPIEIDVVCDYYDRINLKHKIIVDLKNVSRSYIWYITEQQSVADLIQRIQRVYHVHILRLAQCEDSSTKILDLVNNTERLHSNPRHSKPNVRDENRYSHTFEQLIVEHNGEAIGLEHIFRNHSVSNANTLRSTLSELLLTLHCPLRSKLTSTHCTKRFADIPSDRDIVQYVQFVSSNYQTRDTLDKFIYLQLTLPVLTLTIHHNEHQYMYYQFEDEVLIYDLAAKQQYAATKLSAMDCKPCYMDILKLLQIQGVTFMDPNNEHFELDLFEPLQPGMQFTTLYTRALCRHKEINRCVICQQDNVTKSEFTRINCCHHLYHYHCMKKYIEFCHSSMKSPQCPLCRKSFKFVQVHNNFILQTLDINDSEFHDAALMLFNDSDLDEDDDININNINYNNYTNSGSNHTNNHLSAPQIAELDEFYRIGVHLISNSTASNISSLSSPASPASVHVSFNLRPQTMPPPDTPDTAQQHAEEPAQPEEVEESQEPLSRSARTEKSKRSNSLSIQSQSQTQSASYSDRIGRLSLSNLSNSATNGEEEKSGGPIRPSLRYRDSPQPILTAMEPFVSDRTDSMNTPTPKTVSSTLTRNRNGSVLSAVSTEAATPWGASRNGTDNPITPYSDTSNVRVAVGDWASTPTDILSTFSLGFQPNTIKLFPINSANSEPDDHEQFHLV